MTYRIIVTITTKGEERGLVDRVVDALEHGLLHMEKGIEDINVSTPDGTQSVSLDCALNGD